MRFAALLASLAITAIHPALAADPPAEPAAHGSDTSAAVQAPAAAAAADASTATATTTSAAATAPAAASAVETDTDAMQLEKRMRAKGYTTHMENGEKIFCRREQVLGSRLGGAMHCMHADEARANLSREQADLELQRQRLMNGCIQSRNQNGTLVANCGG